MRVLTNSCTEPEKESVRPRNGITAEVRVRSKMSGFQTYQEFA